MDIKAFERLLSGLGDGIRFMNGNEYSAYVHSSVRTVPGERLRFEVEYDARYCEYFASRPSRWAVHLSDDTRRALKGKIPEKQAVVVPAGLGKHILWSEVSSTSDVGSR